MEPRDQLLERKRLRQVVVGAEVQALDAIADRRRRGQHQDPRLRVSVAERQADGVAVDLRQIAVEHDHVVAVDAPLLQGDGTVVGDVGRDPAVTQPVGDVVRQLDVILHNQHAHGSAPSVAPIVPRAVFRAHNRRAYGRETGPSLA